MIRHIVMVKFKPVPNLEALKNELKQMLEHLIPTVKSLKKMEVGLNISPQSRAYDMVLTADFDDMDGLQAYRIHPDHVKILDRLKDVADKTAAVDYEYQA